MAFSRKNVYDATGEIMEILCKSNHALSKKAPDQLFSRFRWQFSSKPKIAVSFQ